VIVGGIHPTIFPDEPLEMGADAVVKGGGDLIWRKIIEDELNGKLQRVYDGGRVPGEQMVKARWDLLDPTKYLMGSIQTVAGCPENCSFCSVWVTEGRTPRLHLNDQIIEEANELHALGFATSFLPTTISRRHLTAALRAKRMPRRSSCLRKCERTACASSMNTIERCRLHFMPSRK
jgi:radical SAM superfamily enzyme YgiQ (UPF0313 family)